MDGHEVSSGRHTHATIVPLMRLDLATPSTAIGSEYD
jgi:hypothetical protein